MVRLLILQWALLRLTALWWVLAQAVLILQLLHLLWKSLDWLLMKWMQFSTKSQVSMLFQVFRQMTEISVLLRQEVIQELSLHTKCRHMKLLSTLVPTLLLWTALMLSYLQAVSVKTVYGFVQKSAHISAILVLRLMRTLTKKHRRVLRLSLQSRLIR